jgi:hypothetical protein
MDGTQTIGKGSGRPLCRSELRLTAEPDVTMILPRLDLSLRETNRLLSEGPRRRLGLLPNASPGLRKNQRAGQALG